MQNDQDNWQSQYNRLVQDKIARLTAMPPGQKAALNEQWTGLFKDVEQALGEDPGGPTAQALATRWLRLLEAFSGEIDSTLAKRFAASYQEGPPPFGDARAWDFIGRALAARA
jgi:hypothetical protein